MLISTVSRFYLPMPQFTNIAAWRSTSLVHDVGVAT
jgi:hypothetical protein